jgi:hypothetical protein
MKWQPHRIERAMHLAQTPLDRLVQLGMRQRALIEINSYTLAPHRKFESTRSDSGSLCKETSFTLADPYTVATGVTGEPTAPGRRSGGAVSRKDVRPRDRSQPASSVNCQSSPSGTPRLKRQ